ncbi:hypothetical protein Pmar_PMAR019557 [Perkinsus marinus ATCC 50983]|uniref:Uncharacterized protein n=1 Tax=Perkinsus marinus (strain ATCC 50983 / TXsc) TaxID=423536 RepID=C5KPB0_PERM5|nr:hypothetical protein Pmar_PMAR019557 [Perkinsus marinus ATCC 50983]EER13684.1 hypothetical protein Pmar_PMAR019557 [Perkinsus marinus ATCC 50983]|eukprot:XP_002781889.1 hypothetical protein Pmar_PMAR019557 [Perkinsus marinus ATCC 50983]
MLKAYAPLMKRLKEVAPDTYDVVKERLKGATKQLSFLESFDPEGWQSIPSEKAKREKLNKATRMIRRLKLGDLEDSAKSILNYFRKSGPHAIDTLATTNCDAETYWKMFSESGSAIEKLIHRTLVAPCSLHPIETRVHPLLDRAQRFKMTSTELFESIVAGWNDRPVLAENVPSQTDAPDVDLTDSPEGKGKNFSSENTVDDSDLVIVSLDDNSSPVASSSYSPMACDDMRAEDSAHPSELSPFICEDFFTYFGEEGCRCYLLRDPPVFDKLDDKPDSILLGLPGDWGRVLKVDQKSISSRGSSFFIYFDATNEQSDLRYYASGLRDLYKARYIVFPSLSTYRAIQQAVDD